MMTLKLRLGLGLGSGRLGFTLYFTRTTSCILLDPCFLSAPHRFGELGKDHKQQRKRFDDGLAAAGGAIRARE